jgi:hypothetical protein
LERGRKFEVSRRQDRRKAGDQIVCGGGDTLLYLHKGEFSVVNTAALQELVGTLFDTVRLTRTSDGWAAECVPLIVDRRALIDVIAELQLRLVKAPQLAAPGQQKLSVQKRQEIAQRLKTGEKRSDVARAYQISEAQVLALAQAQ